MLEGLTKEKQINAFEKKSARQLLVALHEATFGKPFEEIIDNEYRILKSKPNAKAHKIYWKKGRFNKEEIPSEKEFNISKFCS